MTVLVGGVLKGLEAFEFVLRPWATSLDWTVYEVD
jgi:hypothetical protein